MLRIPPDWSVFFVLLASFLIFWFIFKRLFFRPFLALLERRETWFRELEARVRELKQARVAAEEEYNRRISAVRRETLEELVAARSEAQQKSGAIIQEARTEARRIMQQVRDDIAREMAAAEAQLDAIADTLAVTLARRVLGREPSNAGSRTSTPN